MRWIVLGITLLQIICFAFVTLDAFMIVACASDGAAHFTALEGNILTCLVLLDPLIALTALVCAIGQLVPSRRRLAYGACGIIPVWLFILGVAFQCTMHIFFT